MASTTLSRTPSSTTNRRTFTISTWLKLSTASGAKSISHAGTTGGNYTLFDFDTPNTIRAIWASGGSSVANVASNAVYRDINGWYHVVFSVDTTQVTASDRIKIYVNGEQVTSFSSSSYPTQNFDTFHNSTSYANNIGKYITTGGSDANFFDGQMAHYHFIDGTAYAASDFGETDSTTGIWKPKTAPSVSYGSNGFFLKYENSSSMGTDSSGNANNFTVSGNLTQTVDTPSNVFATFNPLINPTSNAPTYSNGNTTSATTTTGFFGGASTLGVSKGKYYCEFKRGSGTASIGIGVSFNPSETARVNTYFGGDNYSWSYYASGVQYHNASSSAFGDSYAVGDIVGIALDMDNNYIYFSKNGVWQNSGDPTSGASGTGGIAIDSGQTYFFGYGDGSSSNASGAEANFGNGYFGTTAVSSAQNPDDGIGIFEYDVPTGYRALCTKSINAEEYA